MELRYVMCAFPLRQIGVNSTHTNHNNFSVFRQSMLGTNDTDRTGGAPNVLKLNEQNIQLMQGPIVIHPFSTFRSIWIILTFIVLLA